MDYAMEEACRLEGSMNEARTELTNAQTKFKRFKDTTIVFAQKRAKTAVGASEKKRRALADEREVLLENKSPESEDTVRTNDLIPAAGGRDQPTQGPSQQTQGKSQEEIAELVAAIEKSIDDIVDRQRERKRLETRVRGFTELNHITKYAVNLSKDPKPRDTLTYLRRTDITPEKGSKRSSEMAEIARDYHNDLQSDGLGIDNEMRAEARREALDSIPPVRDGADMGPLTEKLRKSDISVALEESASGRAAGINGLATEFWRRLESIHKENNRDNGELPKKKTCDIIKVLTWVYNDIEEHGMIEGTDFSLGWMCPLFKKKDRTDIANYRPITVLNSDYKIFTKALTNKLSRVAPYLIHKNQSGFMKGRQITDAIYLAMEVVEYSEDDLQNGIIVALDQEKAYNKTMHSYLWDTLRRHGLPELFINTVKSLYKFADTHVIVNGEISSSFRVTRGVRQGDPLSCLLFNLAIEPLASMLRSSNLRGYKIPGVTENAVVQLFADDTTAYLSEHDSFDDLNKILDRWCLASGARFNVTKTEIIPYGAPEYREHLLETRQLHPEDNPIPPDVHVAGEGEAVRILGGFVGNGVGAFGVWTPVLEKIDSDYERWVRLNPTLTMKKNIDQIVAGSRSQYLAQVNGMPAAATKHILKAQKEFINDSKSSMVSRNSLMAPREQGGIGMFDLEARNKALLLFKAASLTESDPEKRAYWASLALHRLSKHVVKSPLVAEDAKTNLMVQNIKVNQRDPPALHKPIVKCLNKYGISFETVKPSTEILRGMPLGTTREKTARNDMETIGKKPNA
jgi:hypothetical protein